MGDLISVLQHRKPLKVKQFLGRIQMFPVELQNRCYDYYAATTTSVIEAKKKANKYDFGIEELCGGLSVKDEDRIEVFNDVRYGSTSIVHVTVDRGTSWVEAQRLLGVEREGAASVSRRNTELEREIGG